MNTFTPQRFRVRPGVLDHIMRTRRLQTEEQLAAALGISVEDVGLIRSGAPVTARFAMHVATLQGDGDFIAGYFEPIAA